MIGILAPKKETVTSHTRHDLRHNGGRGADNPLPRSLSLHLRAIIPWRDDLRNLGLIAGATTDRLVPHSRQGRSIRGNGTHWDGSGRPLWHVGRVDSIPSSSVFFFLCLLVSESVCSFVCLCLSLSCTVCFSFAITPYALSSLPFLPLVSNSPFLL